MTVAQAREKLTKPVFGDAECIEAVHILESWGTLESKLNEFSDETMIRCEECDGKGRKPCDDCGHDMRCSGCDGTGKTQFSDVIRLDYSDIQALTPETIARQLSELEGLVTVL